MPESWYHVDRIVRRKQQILITKLDLYITGQKKGFDETELLWETATSRQ